MANFKFIVYVRSASTSKAKLNFVPVDKIISVAGWFNTKTFATYYNKPLKTDIGPIEIYLLDFFCSGIQFYLLLSPYLCYILVIA